MTRPSAGAGQPGTAARVRPLSGWLTFAGILILTLGIFHIVGGLAAWTRDDYYLVTSDGLLVFDYTAWGWILFLLGLLQVAVGAGVYTGRDWARLTGIALAVLTAVAHVAFLAAFPLWSVIVIGLAVLVIYALSVPPEGATGL
ncbi:hypothetical protein GCM10009716_16280 [Streptomyces sodiiphilus]|uniref:DUF7144 domain-containing protein n=1 Tax=Streptomyces sodiiphilus TaxID=226217 RepID=A0ABN2P0B2_9ACTN